MDGGQDEQHCWQLEQSLENVDSNEYRCHNGMQSISGSFHRDGSFNPDCLDRSDEQTQVDYWNECYRDPAFRCEEHSCRSDRDGINLPCGDGQCVSRLQLCFNGRDLFVRKEADLLLISSHCEDLMTCLTKMRQSIGKTPCYIVCYRRCASEILVNCPSRFPYPPQFIVLGHIYFLYQTDQANEEDDTILPSYVCYDPSRCPLLSYQFSYNQSRCLDLEKMGIRSEHGYLPWRSLLFLIESYFRDHCSVDPTPSCPPSTMYRCFNSSKCISKVRLLDGVQDCLANDDETYGDSCLLDRQYRFQCSDNRTRCLSSLLIHDGYHDCSGGEEEIQYSMDIGRTQTNISFRTMCDGFRELDPILIDGQYHTDETECEYWPCANRYTQCNRIWNCRNGIDEMFCSNETLNQSIDQLCITSMESTLSSFFISIRNETNCSFPSLPNMFCLNRSTSSNVDMFKQWTTEKYLSFTQIYSLISGCEKNDDHLLPTISEHQLFECKKTKTFPIVRINCELSSSFKPWIYSSVLGDLWNYKYINRIESNPSKDYERPLGLWDCHRGLSIMFRDRIEERKCVCPPSYYGDRCQYENERVSLTLRIETEGDWRIIYTIVVTLVDEEGMIESHDQLFYLPMIDCLFFKFNSYFVYRSRPKNSSKNFTIEIHAFDRQSLNYHGSWTFPLKYSFLPVHRLSKHIFIPLNIRERCSFSCNGHGKCFRFVNQDHHSKEYYCLCDEGWSGKQCSIPVESCDLCSPDSLCFDGDICICRLYKSGDRCYLSSRDCKTLTDGCENEGQCIPSDWRRSFQRHSCLCRRGYEGSSCQRKQNEIMISFDSNILISDLIRVHLITNSLTISSEYTQLFLRVPYDQSSVSFYTKVRVDYLWATLWSDQHYLIYYNDGKISLSDTFNETKLMKMNVQSWQYCRHVNQLFNKTFLSLNPLRRMKYYHFLCQQQSNLFCFNDERHFCHCVNKEEQRQVNCLEVKYHSNNPCQTTNKNFCLNEGQCLQDAHRCPSTLTCICPSCYYGNRCQFNTHGFDLSIDGILGYYIEPDISIDRQPLAVRVSIALSTILILMGFINGVLSLITYRDKTVLELGCGFYLLGLSIITLFTFTLFTLKFWILIFSQIGLITNRSFLNIQCILGEFFLRISLTMEQWLNGCVAIDRTTIIIQGISFNKGKSRKRAKLIILIVLILTIGTLVHDPIHRHLIDDENEDEKRIWCVVNYSTRLKNFDSIIGIVHFSVPLLINFISAVLIIGKTSRQRQTVRSTVTSKQNFYEQFRQHSHLLVAPIGLVLIGIPRLVIALVSGCMNSKRDSWLFLIGYFISFISSTLTFVLFVLPSESYKQAFTKSVTEYRKWIRSCINGQTSQG